ncbi:hypothetical protein GF339_19830 [candidate division KSB3 bacterium]|uniref:DUF1554 domain-containing protein n=1 Tax=candidate division KSB3 bacterium TaxID=2044937 RepID=A0A9D5JYR1_9BACT|nr:hypothetical protein [candidate division KSB3 bacterium]MBD3326844.1 hypothetical protein [candidate division KSB3 bacterium]
MMKRSFYVHKWVVLGILIAVGAAFVSCNSDNSSNPVLPQTETTTGTTGTNFFAGSAISDEYGAYIGHEFFQVNVPEAGQYVLDYTTTLGTFYLGLELTKGALLQIGLVTSEEFPDADTVIHAFITPGVLSDFPPEDGGQSETVTYGFLAESDVMLNASFMGNESDRRCLIWNGDICQGAVELPKPEPPVTGGGGGGGGTTPVTPLCGANTVVIYNSGLGGVSGAFGLATATTACDNNKPTDYTNSAPFLSTSATSIKNIGPAGTDAVYNSACTAFAGGETWSTLFDGDVNDTLANNGVSVGSGAWWSGSTTAGASSGNTCNDWSGTTGYDGTYGLSAQANGSWISDGVDTNCPGPADVLCVAW